jgi:hypothetical protein
MINVIIDNFHPFSKIFGVFLKTNIMIIFSAKMNVHSLSQKSPFFVQAGENFTKIITLDPRHKKIVQRGFGDTEQMHSNVDEGDHKSVKK